MDGIEHYHCCPKVKMVEERLFLLPRRTGKLEERLEHFFLLGKGMDLLRRRKRLLLLHVAYTLQNRARAENTLLSDRDFVDRSRTLLLQSSRGCPSLERVAGDLLNVQRR